MKSKKFKSLISLFAALTLVLSFSSVAFATELEPTENEKAKFGDVLYADDGITVFYGNPSENPELAQEIELQSTKAMQYDYIWVDAHSNSLTRYAYIYASSSNPITYFTVRQEATSAVESSWVVVERPDGSICYQDSWSGKTNIEAKDLVISTKVLWNEPFGGNVYTWTSGTLKLTWNITTGNSGARMCLWAW